MSVSLCMIVKDESGLSSFLDRVKDYVDEIIVVYTGGFDCEVAKKFTDKVYSFVWVDDFSKARNFSISKATKDWILWLDPDEEVGVSDLMKIKNLVSDGNVLGYRMIQESYCDDKLVFTRGICKIFKNFKGIEFVYPVHESVRPCILKVGGRIAKSGIVIKHYPKLSKEKSDYYLKLLKVKKEKFPESNVEMEICFEEEIKKNAERRI